MLPPKNEVQALDLIRAMEASYKAAFDAMIENEQFYDGEIEDLIPLPEGFDLTIPTTLRAIVDEAIDNVMPHDIQVHYAPRGVSKKAEEDADAVRRFLRGVWLNWRRWGSDIDVDRDFGKNLFLHGVAVTKTVPDWTLWPSLPDEVIEQMKSGGKTAELKGKVAAIKDMRQRYFPIISRSLSPRCIMVDPTPGRKLWVVERYESNAAEVRNLYASLHSDFAEIARTQHKHKIHELWTAAYIDRMGDEQKGRVFIFVDDELKFEGENPYGDPPYEVRFSGYGRQSFSDRPELKSVGFFTPQVKSLGKAEARRYSQFDAIMQQLAYPIGLLPDTLDSDSFDVTPGAMNFVPREVMELSEKVWLKANIPDGEYLSSLGAIGAQIERGTTQAPLRGSAIPGTDSAAQLGQYTYQAKLRLDSVQAAMEDALSQRLARVLWYVDKVLQDKVSVFAGDPASSGRYTVGPEQIRGRYDVRVTFQPNEDQVKERRLAMASDALVKGGLSQYDALVYAGFDNPSELVARRQAYEVMQEPEIKRAIGREMLQEWGINADEVEMQERMQMGQMQVMLSDFMNSLQGGTPAGPAMPGALPPGQDPTAALAQQGAGPMPLPVGNQPMDPGLQAPQMVQQ